MWKGAAFRRTLSFLLSATSPKTLLLHVTMDPRFHSWGFSEPPEGFGYPTSLALRLPSCTQLLRSTADSRIHGQRDEEIHYRGTRLSCLSCLDLVIGHLRSKAWFCATWCFGQAVRGTLQIQSPIFALPTAHFQLKAQVCGCESCNSYEVCLVMTYFLDTK